MIKETEKEQLKRYKRKKMTVLRKSRKKFQGELHTVEKSVR